MKTVYFSDVLNKTFDSKKECEDAEKEFNEKKAAEEAEKIAKEAEKKDFLEAIDQATEEIKEAEDAYDALKKEAGDAIDALIKSYKDKLAASHDEITKARNVKSELLLDYNKKFGVYKKTQHFEGSDAEKAYKDFLKEARRFSRFFWD